MRVTLLLLGFSLVILCSPERAKAQAGRATADENIRVVAYNLLNFPDPVPAGREDTFQTISQAIAPDLVLVCELKTVAGAEALLNDGLNYDGSSTFRRADFVSNTTGGSLHNMAFYNQNKLALYEQAVVRTSFRDISRYTFFFRDPFLAGHRDTVFLDAYVLHFKAGSTSSDISLRARMADSLRAAIDRRGLNRNVVVAGDFNASTSAEDAYATLDDPFADVWMRDPANRPGSWGSSSTYADVHTQSTRTSSIFGDGSGGGLDDRYDLMLLSSNVFTGSSRIAYVDDSYAAFGNNGDCYNNTIFSCDPNPVSRRIRSALYYMSDHLPVVLDLEVDYPEFSSIAGPNHNASAEVWSNGTGLLGRSPQGGLCILYNLQGQRLAEYHAPAGEWTWPLPSAWSSGTVLWRWEGQDGYRGGGTLPALRP